MCHLKLNDESGIALLVVLIIAFVSTILASSYMMSVIAESRHSVWQKHRVQSLFLAEAGIEQTLYYLNNPNDPENPWVNAEGEFQSTPLYAEGDLANGYYDLVIYDQSDKEWIPPNSYLVESAGDIPRSGSEDIERQVSCIVAKLDGVPVPAALSIMDWADIEEELIKFQSAVWAVDGRDHYEDGSLIMFDNKGLPGIAVANDGDDVPHQLDKFPDKPHRLDQVKGMRDMDGIEGLEYVEATDAIIEDLSLPKNLDAYANYFRKIALDISGPDLDIPEHLLGASGDYQVLYADLSQGNKKIADNTAGFGVLILEGDGEFEMAGNAMWNGLVICAGDSHISLKGGGHTPAHVNGALMIADGTVEMNGTADVTYSGETIAKVNANLLLYQVYSWCDGWGKPLGSDEYNPITDGDFWSDPADGTY